LQDIAHVFGVFRAFIVFVFVVLTQEISCSSKCHTCRKDAQPYQNWSEESDQDVVNDSHNQACADTVQVGSFRHHDVFVECLDVVDTKFTDDIVGGGEVDLFWQLVDVGHAEFIEDVQSAITNIALSCFVYRLAANRCV